MKIVHIITGLGNGGAENMLYKLLSKVNKNKYNVEVISMIDKGIIGPKIEELGVKIHTLDMKRGIPSLKAIKKTIEIVKDADIIQTWMYHADLLGFICGKIAGVNKIIWGIRHNNLDKDKNKKLLMIIANINKHLSKKVYKIVSCSKDATKVHIAFGYDKEKFVTIPNGFDINNYYKNSSAREDLEKELNLDLNKYKIVSHVARWDILKDYETLIKCINQVNRSRQDVLFLLCGKNIDNNNIELLKLIKNMKIEKNVCLLGSRSDIPNIMSASDLFVLSSIGEGFPNVVGEAMACETPCVVTDAGDCRYIVEDLGKVVDVKDYKALANGILEMLNLPEEDLLKLSKKCREKVVNEFEISKVVSMYEELYIDDELDGGSIYETI